MCFLNGNSIRAAVESGRVVFDSLVEEVPFNPVGQITEDAVDLRLHPRALKFREGVVEVDFLHDDMRKIFAEVVLSPNKGYLLKPGDIIFGQTLEMIKFPDDLVGLIFTRATFAQLGLRVTCDSPKFAVGHNWAFSMQLSNCGPVAIRLYPFSAVAQLMIARIDPGLTYPRSGKLYGRTLPQPPQFNEREKQHLMGINPDILRRIEHLRHGPPADA
jgi:deoxycytidine triphosphate deaminase